MLFSISFTNFSNLINDTLDFIKLDFSFSNKNILIRNTISKILTQSGILILGLLVDRIWYSQIFVKNSSPLNFENYLALKTAEFKG